MTITELIDFLKTFPCQDADVLIQYYNEEAGGACLNAIEAVAVDNENKKCILLAYRDWA